MKISNRFCFFVADTTLNLTRNFFLVFLASTMLPGCIVKKYKNENAKLAKAMTLLEKEIDRTSQKKEELESKLHEVEGTVEKVSVIIGADRDSVIRAAELTVEEYNELKNRLAEIWRILKECMDTIRQTLRLDENELAEGVTIEIIDGRIVITLPGDLVYTPNSADVSDNGKNLLGRLAPLLDEDIGKLVVVRGHTDNDPPKRKWKNNYELGKQRAENVREVLIHKGAKKTIVCAVSRGQWEPLNANRSESEKRANRRVDIIIEPDLSKLLELVEQDNWSDF